jgi:hypothetical protein
VERRLGVRRADRHSRRTEMHPPDLRDSSSSRYAEYELAREFVRFVDTEVLPHVELPGPNKQAERRAILRQTTHNLVLTGLPGRVVADGRTSNAERQRRGIWDALKAAGFATMHPGSEASRKVTRYAATCRLLGLRRHWELRILEDTKLARNTELPSPTNRALVYLHTGKVDIHTGNPLPEEEQRQPLDFREHIATVAQRGPDGQPDPRAIENGMDHFRAMEDIIESINRSNLEHGWSAVCTHEDGTTTTFQPNVCLRQIHVGTFFEAARLYSFGELSGQNLSKAVRRTMRIDGEPAAELDFSGMHPRMLYRRAGHPVEGDPYKPEAVLPGIAPTAQLDGPDVTVRDFLKRCLNACLNARDGRGAVHSSISKKLLELPNTHCLVEQELGGIAGLVNRLLEVHAPIAKYFFTGVGMELMTQDGGVMLAIMRAFRDAGKPALPIHDSVVCRASDAEFTQETMAEVYLRLLTHQPVIKRVF